MKLRAHARHFHDRPPNRLTNPPSVVPLTFHPFHRLAVALFGILLGPAVSLASVEVLRLPDLPVGRAAHTITALKDGRFLVAGGFTDTNQRPVAQVEVFDPARRSFQTVAHLGTARYGHVAALLPDGSVLIAGGWDGHARPVATAELFNPQTGKFGPAASLSGPRAGHLATVLRDGRVLLTGGVGERGEILASAEIYDPAKRRFSSAGSMRLGRENHASVLLSDGRVLICGGHAGRGANLRIHAEAELFDPDRGGFSFAGRLTVPRHRHDAVLLPDGRVLITGGASRGDHRIAATEFFEPSTGAFVAGPSMHHARFKHHGTSNVLADGSVLVLGGAASAERYVPAGNRFETIDSLDRRHAESFAASAQGSAGVILLAGGYDDDIRASATAWLISPLRSPP